MSALTATDLATYLAALKLLADHIKDEEAATKKMLEAELTPGDRKGAVLTGPDGTLVDIGTISYAKGRDTSGWTPTDPGALLTWAQEHHPEAVITTPRLAEWFTAPLHLQGLIESTGEIPDGVEMVKRTGTPSIRTTQSDKQKEAAREALGQGLLRPHMEMALLGTRETLAVTA